MLSRTGDPVTDADLKYDLDCMRYGFAAITPLRTGNSDDVALRKLEGRFSADDVLAVFIDVQENAASGYLQQGPGADFVQPSQNSQDKRQGRNAHQDAIPHQRQAAERNQAAENTRPTRQEDGSVQDEQRAGILFHKRQK